MEEQTAEDGRRKKRPVRSEGEAMREYGLGDALPAAKSGEQQVNAAYGCAFCVTGKEQLVADRIQSVCPEVHAVTMRQLKYRTHKGVKFREEAIVLPSYVFFKAPSYAVPVLQFPRQNLIRVLTLDDGRWQLTGEDERFVQWLFQYDGLLGFSQAYREGDQIRIVSGPLKDMEGRVARVDKRGCSGQVVLSFYGKDIPVWLGFELIHPL